MRRGDAGFTLVELLVALAILGTLVAGLAQGLRLGATAWDRQSRLAGWQEDLRVTERVLRGLVAQADPGAEGEPAPFRGLPGALLFRSVPRTGGAAADVALGVDDARRLVLRLVPVGGDAGMAQEVALVAGVERLEVSYWPGRGTDLPARWTRVWSERQVPGLVLVHLVLAQPGRRWPEIVMRPALDRLD